MFTLIITDDYIFPEMCKGDQDIQKLWKEAFGDDCDIPENDQAVTMFREYVKAEPTEKFIRGIEKMSDKYTLTYGKIQKQRIKKPTKKSYE